ncbi:PD40 domain-containing protein [Actinokineospora soli]
MAVKSTVVGVAAAAALAAGAVLAVAGPGGGRGGALDLDERSLVYVDEAAKRVAQDPGGVSGVECLRSYTAGGTLVCLHAVALPPGFSATVLNDDLEVVREIRLDGTPSRARVSPSGRMAAWTVFRSGDSYLPAGYFSTTATILDTETGTLYGSLEDFTSIVDGKPYAAEDRNYWGVTIAEDDNLFYATMSSKGKTWLMRGDLAARTLTAVRQNAECPSLSPDGTRVAYKVRTGEKWRLHVLDLATGADTPTAETAHVDDQAAWLDDRTIAYSRPGPGGKPAVYAVPADGSGAPRLVREGASSPAAIP